MGQRISALRTNDENDPVRAQTNLVSERVSQYEKKNGKGSSKQDVVKEKKRIEAAVKEELESMNWDEFINSLEC
jgi:hypothetical protein